jgi:hypothetical protein
MVFTHKDKFGREIVDFKKTVSGEFVWSDDEATENHADYLGSQDQTELDKSDKELWFEYLPELEKIVVNEHNASRVQHRNLRSVSTFIMHFHQLICNV